MTPPIVIVVKLDSLVLCFGCCCNQVLVRQYMPHSSIPDQEYCLYTTVATSRDFIAQNNGELVGRYLVAQEGQSTKDCVWNTNGKQWLRLCVC